MTRGYERCRAAQRPAVQPPRASCIRGLQNRHDLAREAVGWNGRSFGGAGVEVSFILDAVLRCECDMRNEEFSAFIRGKIVAVCEAVLNEEIGVIAGSRRLKGLMFELCGDHDEDFMAFVGIDSDTDRLPVDWERRNWGAEALGRINHGGHGDHGEEQNKTSP